MKEKMAKTLKERYSNLGLSKEVLNSVAAVAVVGLADDADDAAILARATSPEIADMVKTFQKTMDKRVTEAQRAAEDKNKGEDDDPIQTGKEAPAWMKEYMKTQQDLNKSLSDKIAALEGASKKRNFDELCASIGKELGLNDKLLGLSKAGLSPDSDETAIRDHFGSVKKTLLDSGAQIDGEGTRETIETDNDEDLRSEAREWVERNAKTNE